MYRKQPINQGGGSVTNLVGFHSIADVLKTAFLSENGSVSVTHGQDPQRTATVTSNLGEMAG